MVSDSEIVQLVLKGIGIPISNAREGFIVAIVNKLGQDWKASSLQNQLTEFLSAIYNNAAIKTQLPPSSCVIPVWQCNPISQAQYIAAGINLANLVQNGVNTLGVGDVIKISSTILGVVCANSRIKVFCNAMGDCITGVQYCPGGVCGGASTSTSTPTPTPPIPTPTPTPTPPPTPTPTPTPPPICPHGSTPRRGMAVLECEPSVPTPTPLPPASEATPTPMLHTTETPTSEEELCPAGYVWTAGGSVGRRKMGILACNPSPGIHPRLCNTSAIPDDGIIPELTVPNPPSRWYDPYRILRALDKFITIVSDPFYAQGQGIVYIFEISGSASILTIPVGCDDNCNFGSSLARAMIKVNTSLTDVLLIGASNYANTGGIFIFSIENRSLLFTMTLPGSSFFGHAIEVVNKVNASDTIIITYNSSGSSPGISVLASIFEGLSLDGEIYQSFNRTITGNFDYSPSIAATYIEDNLFVVFGFPQINDNSGAVFIVDVSSHTGPSIDLSSIGITDPLGFKVAGEKENIWLGYSVDITNTSSIIIGAPGFDCWTGRVYVLTSPFPTNQVISSDQIGASVSGFWMGSFEESGFQEMWGFSVNVGTYLQGNPSTEKWALLISAPGMPQGGLVTLLLNPVPIGGNNSTLFHSYPTRFLHIPHIWKRGRRFRSPP